MEPTNEQALELIYLLRNALARANGYDDAQDMGGNFDFETPEHDAVIALANAQNATGRNTP